MAPIVLTIGAVDRGWSMGEDIRLEIDTQTQMKEVFQLIAARKSIPKSRFVIKIPAFLEAAPASNPAPELADNEFEWEKGKVQGKADWPVRRCGVYDGLRVVVSPVFPGAWAWETNEWYEDVYMDALADFLKHHPEQCATLQEIAVAVAKPKPLRCSLRAFLRKYPEIFHLEVNQNNNSGAGLIYARLNTNGAATAIDTTVDKNASGLQRLNITGTVHKIGSRCPTVV